MKRITLALAVIILMISTSSNAQSVIRFGLKGGLNFANLNVEGFSSDGTTGFHAGAYLTVKITKFAVQPEVLYSLQGADGLDLSYVNIPIMAKFYLVQGLHIEAGPQFGVLLTAEDDDGTDLKEFVKTSDLSAAFGAGFDLPFGLGVGARYVLGLSSIDDTGSSIDVKNQVFMVSLWYALKK